MNYDGATFRNREVELDGNEFTNCFFENVTFIYSGGPLRVYGPTIGGKISWKLRGPLAGFYRHSADLRIDSPIYDPPLDGVARNVETISFVLGRIFVHVNAARIANFEIESRFVMPKFYGNCRIWPPANEETIWPREPVITKSTMRLIGDSFSILHGTAKKVWMPLKG